MTAKWDALDIALLETMIHQGKSSKEIAEALGEGVTPEVVRQQAHRRGFKRPTILERAGKAVRDPDDLATLLKAYAPSIEERAQDAPLLLQERLASYVGDPLAFLADFAPLKLLPYQEAMVRAIHDHPYTLLLCGRGVGKSTLASWYAVWYAFSHPGATILLIGSIERQAAIDFEFCRSFIQSNPLLSSSLVEFSQSFIQRQALLPPGGGSGRHDQRLSRGPYPLGRSRSVRGRGLRRRPPHARRDGQPTLRHVHDPARDAGFRVQRLDEPPLAHAPYPRVRVLPPHARVPGGHEADDAPRIVRDGIRGEFHRRIDQRIPFLPS